jgi:hypothetical protein
MSGMAPWLPINHPCRNLVETAIAAIGICEEPPGSNRGPQVDQYNRDAGVPDASYWCAAAVGAWYRTVQLPVPIGYASCENWHRWAKQTGRWSDYPAVGAAVLYGKEGVAHHIGLIIRTVPLILSVEGNTTIEGAAFAAARNGVGVSLKEITPQDAVLGYVLPNRGT